MKIIRKISVGKGFPDDSLHYQVNKEIRLGGIPYIVHSIEETISDNAPKYTVYLQGDEGIVEWKSIIGVPVVLEYNIDFE